MEREEAIAQYLRWGQEASAEIARKRIAIQVGDLSAATVDTYLSIISQCEKQLRQYEETLDRLRQPSD